jgi:predicted RNase H-like nuclease (RuvC/YqgF family)
MVDYEKKYTSLKNKSNIWRERAIALEFQTEELHKTNEELTSKLITIQHDTELKIMHKDAEIERLKLALEDYKERYKESKDDYKELIKTLKQ